MKTMITLVLVGVLSIFGFSQNRVIPPQNLRNIAIPADQVQLNVQKFTQAENPYLKASNVEIEEEQIGVTRYDNQSNASIPKKIYMYPDGTIAATWTRSMQETMFPDRGAGYNYFDGSNWEIWPEERVEDIKTHRPSYAPLGVNGELIVSHVSFEGLYLSMREEKGTGEWDYEEFPGPSGNPFILWNRTVTSGADRNRIHILALTLPTSHGGSAYAGLDGALLYSYSTDGGNSWYWDNDILEGMTQDDYAGFTGDNYAFAEPKGDVIAFTVGDTWYDLFLMKSTDGGESFEKTIIWEHPYPMWQLGTQTDTFYCVDGSHALAIDSEDRVHVAFGITRTYADDQSTYLYPLVDGIAYWNEDMPTFSNNLNALSPYGDAGSELVENYNLIGWTQDVNGNGEIDILAEFGNYWLGLSSMPQLIIDDQNKLFLVYSSVTETYHNGFQNYRHLWTRASPDGGDSWGASIDLTSDVIHTFDECVYPACSPTSDDYIYLTYQADENPGTAVWGAQHEYVDNKVMFSKVPKQDILITGINENEQSIYDYDVSQNYPNPFSSTALVKVNLRRASDIQITVTNLEGQLVFESDIVRALPGMNVLEIDGSMLNTGLYFYTVKAGESTITKKMIIE